MKRKGFPPLVPFSIIMIILPLFLFRSVFRWYGCFLILWRGNSGLSLSIHSSQCQDASLFNRRRRCWWLPEYVLDVIIGGAPCLPYLFAGRRMCQSQELGVHRYTRAGGWDEEEGRHTEELWCNHKYRTFKWRSWEAIMVRNQINREGESEPPTLPHKRGRRHPLSPYHSRTSSSSSIAWIRGPRHLSSCWRGGECWTGDMEQIPDLCINGYYGWGYADIYR